MNAADREALDELAQAIRALDGNHDLGAAALADALAPTIEAITARALNAAADEINDLALGLIAHQSDEGHALTAAVLDRAARIVRARTT